MQLTVPRDRQGKNSAIERALEKVGRRQCHVVTSAYGGLSEFSVYCRQSGVDVDQKEACIEKVNEKGETGTLYPKANITIVPIRYARLDVADFALYRNEFMQVMRDAFIAERDYVRSRELVFDFSTGAQGAADYCCACVSELIAGEFRDLQGESVFILP